MSASTTPSSSNGELPLDIEKQRTQDAASQKVQNMGEAPSNSSEDDDQWKVELEPDFDTTASGAAGALNRVLSRISTNASWNPGPPPDGGRQAWLMCK
jgi:hypothetical protein